MYTDLARWDPFRQMSALRQEIDRALAATGEGSRLPSRWAPTADVIERDDEFLVTAELPGVKDEDLDVRVEHGTLVVSGERRLEDEVSEDRYYRIERSYGGFERRFPLPAGVGEDDIQASIAYGVLRVRIPKPSAPEPKRISVSKEEAA